MAQFSSGRILSQFIFKNTEAVQVSEQENELVWSRDFACIPASKYRPNCINKSPVISRQDRNIRGRTISGGSAYRSEVRGKEKEKKKKKRNEKGKEGGLVIRGLKSHRISAYRFLPIGEGRAVGKIEANGKKEGGKKGKGYK